MDKTDLLDVLVVYSQDIATSATSSLSSNLPFLEGSSRAHYNNAYSYLLSTCAKYSLSAGLSTTSDITGAGSCRSYWLYENNQWIKVKNCCFAPLIFDKFSPLNQKAKDDRSLMFSSSDIKPFNDKYLLNLFHDKNKTYKKLTYFSIPTVILRKATYGSIDEDLHKLSTLVNHHRFNKDFSSEIILKDRFGAGGDQIYKITSPYKREILSIMNKNKAISFIIQPFVKFEKGYSYQNKQNLTDIRLIYMKKKLVQTYIRMAKLNDFRCNEHQGGNLKYITKKEIPPAVMRYAQKILKTLGKKTSLFALDFIVSNNGNVFFVEGNTGPGIDWNLSKKDNEQKAKKLIRIIVKELGALSES